MATIETVARKLKKTIETTSEREISAITGRLETDGSFTLPVEGATNQIWVRLEGLTNQTVPCYSSKQPQSNIHVKVKEETRDNNEKVYTLLRVDLPQATEVLGDAAKQYDSTQTYDELSTATVGGRRLLPGRVRLHQAGTLIVYIEPFDYLHEGVPKRWPGGTIDLADYITTTANMQNMVKVGVDPVTNTAVAEAGPDYPGMITLDESRHTEILFADYIPCEVVILKEGETTISDYRRIFDCRCWIWTTTAGGGGMTSFTLAGNMGIPQTISNGNTLTVAGGQDIDTAAGATDILTVSTKSRVSAAVSLYLYDNYFNFS